MEFFAGWRKDNRGLFQEIQANAVRDKVRLYLVGGALRDVILKKNRSDPDFDFCLKKNAVTFARKTARAMNAGFVVLDKDHGCARIVRKEKGRTVTLDFSDFRGPALDDDLHLRDFTINSLAAALDDILSGPGLDKIVIDPCGGRLDLDKRLIRTAYARSFDDDPLRVMRAFSLSAVLGFRIDGRTRKLAVSKRNKLRTVSMERIRDELFKVLASPAGYEIISELDSSGILELAVPHLGKIKKIKRPALARLGVWRHTLLTLQNTEALIKHYSRNPAVKAYLETAISSGRSRADLLKLAALVHDVGKPGTFKVEDKKIQFHGHERLGSYLAGDVCARLKLSNEESRILRRIVFLHLRPGYLVTNPALTAKARFRFFRDAGEEAGSVLFLALADERSTKGYLLLNKIRAKYEKVIPRLIREYFSPVKEEKRERLINGDDIMARFGLEPSLLIGKLLRDLEELQALGKIKSRQEAFNACAGLLKGGRAASQGAAQYT